ncbi:hypothetical protein SUGI_1021680 [Cryptomeria japonica]|nr:hypothetical protein SUGI_1021680 [Cryptomeria japonica]
MDLNVSVSAIGLTILLFTVSLSVLLGLGKKKNRRFGLPGPFALPIIGNLHQLGALPHRSLQRLAEKHGPIMSMKLGSLSVVVASTSEAAKHFLKTHDLVFASRPSTAAAKYLFYNQKDIVFGRYGDYWRNMRKLCMMELLNVKRIESFQGVREEQVLAMVRSIWEKSEEGKLGVDVSQTVACYISDVMWRILTGKTNTDRLSSGTAFEDLVWEGNFLMGAINIGDFIPWLDWLDLQGLKRRMKNVQHRLDAVFDKIIDEHVEHKGRRSAEEGEEERHKDLIDVLVDMDITDEDKKGIIMDMFLGGIESSAITLEWVMRRDPSVWEDPLEFRPERFMGKNFDMVKDQDLRMIPFGSGRRGCPGASMAIANIAIALVHLVHCFNWKSDEELDMNESFGSTIPRKEHLFAIPTWRLSENAPSSLKI